MAGDGTYSGELQKVIEVYQDDLNSNNFATQLEVLYSTIPAGLKNISDIMTYLKELSPAEKELMNEVITIAKIILVMPATNSSSERSFSAMRRVKSYLRSTMTQERLNSLMILHVNWT